MLLQLLAILQVGSLTSLALPPQPLIGFHVRTLGLLQQQQQTRCPADSPLLEQLTTIDLARLMEAVPGLRAPRSLQELARQLREVVLRSQQWMPALCFRSCSC